MSALPPEFGRIRRGTQRIISEGELLSKLRKKRPLRVKLGVDPTAPDLHLGHTVTLNKLRQFQEMGHTVVFIVGDYTALVGDPSGRTETRPPLTPEEVKANTETYLSQLGKILKQDRMEVHYNSAWLRRLFSNQGQGALGWDTLLGLLSRHTVQQLVERDDFSKRIKTGSPVSLLELFYPLLQGYDSAVEDVKADIEIGGTDQLFNLLMGREVQKDAGQDPQVVITMPLLEGTDGVKKMSKSYGNAIGLNDTAEDMFGKVMSVSDGMMLRYYELLTDKRPSDVKAMHPKKAKEQLAELITVRYHGSASASAARASFERVFSQKKRPENLKEHKLEKAQTSVVALILEAGLAPSRNEARRLLRQGAVLMDEERVSDDKTLRVKKPLVLKVGKRNFRRILPPDPS